MQETVWHSNTGFQRHGLKLRQQHQTLPPTPENAAENYDSDTEGDVTEGQNGVAAATSVMGQYSSPAGKAVFFSGGVDGKRQRPKSAPEHNSIIMSNTPECEGIDPAGIQLSATTDRSIQTPSFHSSIRRHLPPNLHSEKLTTNSVSSDERGPQTPFQPDTPTDPKCHRWSLNQLRKQFQEVKIEDLYQRFWLRLQQNLLLQLLVVFAICITIFLILNNSLVEHKNNPITIIWTNVFLGMGLLLCAVCGALVFNRRIFTRFSIPISVLTWFCLIIFLYAFMPFPAKKNITISQTETSQNITNSPQETLQNITISPTDNVPMTFFVIFVIYTMLPSPRRVLLALGVLTAILDLVVVGIHMNSQPDFDKLTLFTNALVYVSAIVTGFYHKHLMDLAHRHTFLDVRRFIEEDIQITKERDRQNRMKEGLLLKIIPKHLLEGMKKVLNKNLVEVNTDNKNVFSDVNYESTEGIRTLSLKRIGVRFYKKAAGKHFPSPSSWTSNTSRFRELFVTKSELASILYADIVSFTPLTMSLTPAELVGALNELFGRFDELGKANKCLRIKILGDCYYCVSGLPDPTKDHARNAVIMGMQMIKVIARIREETGLEKLDMRIGIHSGHLLSGVLGLKKWQYDVWSDDVTIANHMESSGQPGKVHITAATLNELNNEFEVLEAHGKDRDELLKENNIETYFIADHELEKVVDDEILRLSGRRGRSRGLQRQKAIKRRISVYEALEGWGAEMPFEGMTEFMMSGTLPALHEVNRRLEKGFHLQRSTLSQDDSLQRIFNFKFDSLKAQRSESRRSSTKSDPEEAVDGYRQRLRKHKEEINQKTLMFRNQHMEEKYANQLDESFKFYVLCALCIFAFLTTVQLIQFNGSTIIIINLIVGGLIFLMLITISTGLKFMPFYERLPKNFKDNLASYSQICVSDFRSKIVLSLVSSVTIFVSSVVPMIDCQSQNTSNSSPSNESVPTNAPGGILAYLSTTAPPGVSSSFEQPCLFAPYFLYSCMLALIVCSVFLRVSYIFKIVYMTVCLLLYNIMFHVIFPEVFTRYDSMDIHTYFIKSQVRGTLYTALLFVTLVVLGRQIEQNLRLDFLCKSKIQIDRQELRRNEMLNTLLLNNILPSHVAAHFTNPKRRKNELYHQLCKNAVVIFAAVPNFKAFFSEIDVTGKECLRMLNEIISSFDDMLIMRQYDGVEKIKTIGSTYMAASGLVPSEEDDSEKSAIVEKNLVVMIQFAFGMMKKLEELSKDAFFEYKLRIGVCHGEVIAGVVGAQKPQYDIWGDTVNTASRMESHGVMGAIQVPEETALILQGAGYSCEYRDEIDVKGKGKMKVYLVQTPDKKASSESSIPELDNGRVQIYRQCRRALYLPESSN